MKLKAEGTEERRSGGVEERRSGGAEDSGSQGLRKTVGGIRAPRKRAGLTTLNSARSGGKK
jgi:hypothetical protein